MIDTNIFLFKDIVFTFFCVFVMVCACRGERSEYSASNVKTGCRVCGVKFLRLTVFDAINVKDANW